jgi:hypothetical protein
MTHSLLPLELQIVACATLLAFFSWVIHLVRFQHLSLRDSLLWLISTGVVLVFAVFPRLLRDLASAIAVQVPSNALFGVAIVYLALNVVWLTIALSNGATRARRLAQECALLRADLEAVQARLEKLAP